MKKYLLLLLFVSIHTAGFSQSMCTPMQLYYDTNIAFGSPRQHKSSVPMPSVSYDENSLYIIAPFEIERATITIYNEEGEDIYFIETPLSPDGIILTLPQYVNDERYSLELSYGSLVFIGYF